MNQEFKSIHIDLENQIFFVNGKQLTRVNTLKLENSGDYWSLRLNVDEVYEAPTFKKGVDKTISYLQETKEAVADALHQQIQQYRN